MHQMLHAGDDPLAKQNTYELFENPTRPESYLERIEMTRHPPQLHSMQQIPIPLSGKLHESRKVRR